MEGLGNAVDQANCRQTHRNPFNSHRRQHDLPHAAGVVIRRQGELLAFEDFALLVRTELRLSQNQLGPEARLEEDLGLDSVEMLDLVLLVDELGVEISEQVVPGLQTLGEVHAYYSLKVTQSQ
jgi:acyl carrier protein